MSPDTSTVPALIFDEEKVITIIQPRLLLLLALLERRTLPVLLALILVQLALLLLPLNHPRIFSN